jgi:NADH:ubiquinone oxidoreductase subunit F (NADH-binding)
MGSSLNELLELAGAADVKMVQVGGASGGIVPDDKLDTPLAFETILGAGAVIVFDQSRDVIDMVNRTIGFLAEESCGKCTPCREGLEVMVEIFGRLSHGSGVSEDLRALENLSEVMISSSLCGLGQSAAIPVLDTLRYFRSDYETRILQSLYFRSVRSLTG